MPGSGLSPMLWLTSTRVELGLSVCCGFSLQVPKRQTKDSHSSYIWYKR